jgi:hypothetical protein
LLLREHERAVDDDVELTEAAPANFRRDAQALRQVLSEAPGLPADVASDEAALDLDVHVGRIAQLENVPRR